MLDKHGNVIIYPADKLYGYALRKLGSRAHSCHELITKMHRLQPDMSIVISVVDKLKALNYLNDLVIVRMVFNTYFKKEGLSKIKNRLNQKGICKEDIEQGLADCLSEIEDVSTTEIENATNLLIRKFKQFNADDYAKYFRFLANKQFNSTIIKKALTAFKSAFT